MDADDIPSNVETEVFKFTTDILTEWGLDCLVNKFLENHIDEETFNNLNVEDLKELIPQLGLRKKFAVKHQQYVLLKTAEKVPILVIDQISGSNDTDDTVSITTSSDTSTTIIDLDELEPKAPYSLKATLGIPYNIIDVGKTVKPLLDSTDEGALIKKSYGPNSKFLRTNLCNLIIKNELQNSVNKRISTERFIKLATEINDVFMHEESAIYYIPYCKGSTGKVVAAKGKLWSTYVHQRQLYKKAGLLKNCHSPQPSCSTTSLDSVNEVEEEGQYENDTLWLRNNTEPFEQVFRTWKNTVKQRLKFNGSIEEYFKQFPALSTKTGYILLESDFEHLYKENNCFFTKWPIYAKIILDNLKKKKDSYLQERLLREEESDLSDDTVQILALKYLPLLLQSPLIKTKHGKHWKLSKQELLESFILSVDDISDLDTAIQLRIQRCHTHKLTAQPIPIFVGSRANLQTYVSVNKTLYKTENPLRAIDVCFKIYHALNASYPAEAEPSWLFLQKGVYCINTKLDKKFSSVDTLIADIKIAVTA